LEILEDRILLATARWINAAGGDWGEASNWDIQRVPSSSDDVIIDMANVTVTHSTGSDSINRLTLSGSDSALILADGTLTIANTVQVTNGTFSVNAGTLTAQSGLTINNGRFNFNGGSLTGTVTLINSALNIDPASTSAANFVLYGSDSLAGDIAPGQTLTLLTSWDYSTSLSVAAGVVNAGTIRLDSPRGDRATNLAAPDGLVNAPGGLIDVVKDGDGGRNLSGAITNQGTLRVASGIGLYAGGTFTQQAGSIAVSGYLQFTNTTFHFDGGTIGGTVTLVNSALAIGAGSTGTAGFALYGTDSLAGNIATGQTLALLTSWDYSTTLTVAAGVVNAGTLRLDSPRGDRFTTLVAPALVNAAGGLIDVATDGGGGRNLSGTLTNQGVLRVASGIGLYAGGTFTQQGGSIAVSGYLQFTGSTFHFDGGTVTGTVTLVDSALTIGAGSTGAANFALYGVDSLTGNIVPGQTLTLLTSWDYSTSLTVAAGVVNAGTIRLDSPRGDRSTTLAAPDGLVNAPGGLIDVVRDGGGGRNLSGTITNQGTLRVASGIGLYAGGTFTQQAGSIAVSGYLQFTGSTFHFDGGTIGGTVTLVNSALAIGAGSTGTASFALYGSDSLAGDIAPGQTLALLTSYDYNTTLTVAAGVVNAGTIRLDSPRGDRTTNLVAPGLVNAPGGLIDVVRDGGGGRNLSGPVLNQGTLQVASDISLYANGTFTQQAGSIAVSGYLQFTHSTFHFDGGTVTGTVTVVDCALTIGAGSAGTARFALYGADSLAGDIAPGQTLALLTSYDYNTTLTVAAGVVNAGTIRLDSPRGDRTTTLAAPGGLVNAPGGLIDVVKDGDGGRNLSGTITNQGALRVASGIGLYAGGTFTQQDGSIAVSGYLQFTHSTFHFDGSTVTGTVTLVDSALTIGAGSTGAASFALYGSDSLAGNIAPGQTLTLLTSWDYSTTLTVAAGVVNAGTIRLDSPRGDRFTTLVAAGTLVNAPGGLIDVVKDGDGGRNLSGAITNQGTLRVVSGIGLYVGGTFTQQGGSIAVSGYLQFTNASFHFDGGAVTGTVTLVNSALAIGAGSTGTASFALYGSDSLSGDIAPGQTLALLTSWDYSTTLTVAAGVVNAGTIRLDSPRGDRFTTLVAAGTLVNAPGGLINVVTDGGGGRNLSGTITNQGVFRIGWMSAVSFTGNYTQTAMGVLEIQVGGSNMGNYPLAITGTATLSGTLSISLINNYVPNIGDSLTLMTCGPRSGAFARVTGLDPSTGRTFAALYDLNSVSGLNSVSVATIPTYREDTSPQRGSNLGQATLTVHGAQFAPDATVSLVSANVVQRTAGRVLFKDHTTLFATFDLTGLTPGPYDVRVLDHNRVQLLPGAFTVTAGPLGHVDVHVNSPSQIRPNRQAIATVEYVNSGDTDVPAPLLAVVAENAVLRLPEQNNFAGETIQFLGINMSGPAGILTPGARGSVSLVFLPENFGPHVRSHFTLKTLTAPDTPLDWNSLKAGLRPPVIPADAWEPIFANFTAQVGTTLGQYQALLDDYATYLSQLGVYTPDVGRLLSFAFAQADDTLPRPTLDSRVDASAPAPGLPLVFARTYHQPLSGRYRLGTLGRGWSSAWDGSATADPDGNVTVQLAGGFRLFRHQADGSYLGMPGDNARLTLQSGTYRLRETDGTLFAFRTDGLLDSVQDTNGNRITLGYTDGRLTSLTHSNGSRFLLSYNGQGRLSQLTDQAGRLTSYTYDASGEHLLSVTGPGGTTAYTYDTGDGPAREHALLSITNPDGTHLYFDYDDQGRLIGQHRDGGVEPVRYVYDSPGGFSMTDATNATTTLLLDDAGQVGQVRDPLGRVLIQRYDAEHHLVQRTAPGGLKWNYEYDGQGHLISEVDPLQRRIDMTYDPTLDRLTSFRDAGGHTTRYAYDAQGNLRTITYADGSAEQFSYDPLGNLTEAVNRREQPLRYTYDSRGLVTRKDYADGSHVDFTYDDRGNLLTATDARGTTTLQYDGADRLLRITYPNGRFLQFTYDTGGRRSRMVDQSGFTVNYIYDAAGRLKGLTDGQNQTIVNYIYDDAGRLARKELGNGTYTTYAYDPAGQLLHLVNFAPGGAVNSRFDYTYDDLGRRTSMTTLDGTWTYGYDGAGELTSVQLPNGRTIQYVYDAAGNRVSVLDDGTPTNYTTNDLNQYTSVGANDYVYDTDGNLISQSDGVQTRLYVYDQENQLVQAVTPEGTSTYEYDAFGNRVAKVVNGQRTEYLIDPAGIGNVVGEYNGAGNLAAHYTYGLGLTSRVDAANVAAYYDFDAIGSTVGLTDAAGRSVNTYTYLPFGELLTSTETIFNPFGFVGQWGVMQEGNGLHFMRARYYDAAAGRFIAADPLGLQGGDLNFYRYAGNNPVSAIDPQGTCVWIVAGVLIGAAVNTGLYLLTAHLTGQQVTLGGAIGAAASGAIMGGFIAAGAGPGALFLAAIGSSLFDSSFQYGFDAPNHIGDITADAIAAGLTFRIPWRPLFISSQYGFGNFGKWALLRTLFWLNKHSRSLWATISVAELTNTVVAKFLEKLFWLVEQITSNDPNDILGPAGFGPERLIVPAQRLGYTIRFENEADASAPAQVVRITLQLDPNLDFRTFQFGDFGLGGLRVHVPEGSTFFRTRLDLRGSRGLFVDVVASIDVATGLVTWTFTSLDPANFELPTDLLVGFVPPNDSTGKGEGFVTYSVLPRSGIATGTRIYATARILFDDNAPVDTPLIFNTIGDATSFVAGSDPGRNAAPRTRKEGPEDTPVAYDRVAAIPWLLDLGAGGQTQTQRDVRDRLFMDWQPPAAAGPVEALGKMPIPWIPIQSAAKRLRPQLARMNEPFSGMEEPEGQLWQATA
jgi:RHS repeat-associated protein